MDRTNQELTALASKASGIVYRCDVTNYTRNEMQEAFRVAALTLGVENKTKDMGSIVTRCMARAGFGT